ncbi:n-terminal domain protein [Ichthyophthirius multifiliis]|uniref:Cyclin n=1 Tax=Ichthyophthirius multifiliis TaxID=5932 RepID=G0QN07_ICHMU|nr:n-terminal domain protein [Ichthyophthirius multifiliis]EGR33397.1 n-terminal domain protein [Ichthyophthirius multifiliis]|eukprot:XP_004037383.1 n-terminal domain protein [Ichthyophthirius multifiliis]
MNQFDEQIIFQNEKITYDQIYKLNGYQQISNENILQIISNVLTEITLQCDKLPIQFITNFHGKNIPNISINDYLLRINKLSGCTQECYIMALIYIDRITERHKNFLINSYSIHRIIITSVMISIKFYEDKYYNNEYYAKIGGISLQEVNQLERDFLQLINFRLYINPVLFYNYREKILDSG